MTPERRSATSIRMKEFWKENAHPRGALGMRHSPATRRKLGEISSRRWSEMTDEKKSAQVLRMLKTRKDRGTLILPRPHASWKQAWHTVGGKRHYFRSKWEVNYAFYLEWLKGLGEIQEWEYEPETFWFEKIRRGTRSYTPDFRITEKGGKVVYHEVKGWMDDRSKTKIKRMGKYHPDVRLIVIDAKAYKAIARKALGLVPGWD